MSKTARSIPLAVGTLAYGILARHVHNSIIQSEWPAGYDSLNPVYLSAFVVLSVLFLVYAWRTVWRTEYLSADWGLALLGRAWISVPIVVVILTLSLLGAKAGPAKPIAQVIASVLILLPSSIIIRSFLMRVISDALGQKKAVAWLGIVVTGILFTLVHRDRDAWFLSDFVWNCLGSSFVATTGSCFAPLVLDSVRLLNPPASQSAIIVPLAGLVCYLVPATITGMIERKVRVRTSQAEKQ